MTPIERILLAATACTFWILLLGDRLGAPAADAQTLQRPDRQMSEILHELVAQAARGEQPRRQEGYDEIESRLQTVLSRALQTMPRQDGGQARQGGGLTRQEIKSTLNSCRLVGTLSGVSGRVDARLSC